MLCQTKEYVKEFIRKHFVIFVVLACFFLCGFCFARICANRADANQGVTAMLHTCLRGLAEKQTLSASVILSQAGKSALLFAFLYYIFTVSFLGVAAFPIYSFVKGIAYGFVLFALFSQNDVNPYLVLVTNILPHVLFSAPLYLFACGWGVAFSADTFRGVNTVRRTAVYPLVTAFVFLVLSAVPVVVQAYIEPFFTVLIFH